MGDFDIVDVEAVPCSVPMKEPVRMGVGMVVKREAVVVKVTTAGGLIGYGEAHHARAPAGVAAIVNTTMRDLLIGRNALETVPTWDVLFRNQMATHGTGAAGACALSGVDIALWDLRGKAVGWPLYRLLGGTPRRIPTYAGGISLGYQDPAELVAEVKHYQSRGFQAVKLRIGDTVAADLARVAAVREGMGPDFTVMTDANAQYTLAQAQAAAPELAQLGVTWLEEPFPPFAVGLYRRLAAGRSPALAAGENHYGIFEIRDLIAADAVGYLQPDASKCGGVTSIMRIAALSFAASLPLCPHTSITGINMAATLHIIASVPNAEWFESEVAAENRLRDELTSTHPEPAADGCVVPPDGPGLGIEIDEDFLRGHPLTPGPAFVPS